MIHLEYLPVLNLYKVNMPAASLTTRIDKQDFFPDNQENASITENTSAKD